MSTRQPTTTDPLEAGRAALARGAWESARLHFEDALAREETADALDGLGWAGWWLGDEELALGARERAFRAYRSAGDPGGAARVAAWLAADFREFRGEHAIARGWLARGRRLLDGVPESVDHGWVEAIDADLTLNIEGDAPSAERLSAAAARIGRELGVPDLEAIGLAQGGIALVLLGHVDEGMRRLDEATAIATTEELQFPVSLAWSMCCLVSACDGVGDFPRAAQWCGVMRDFNTRWGGRQILGICRSAYGRVLATSGDWPAADVELTAAVRDLEAARPGMASGGLVRLAELRARQGRADEARALLERAGWSGLVGLGELALADGDATAAADAAARVLRALPPEGVLPRLPALELLVRARARAGDLEQAAQASVEVADIAAALGTPYLRGRAHLVAAEVAAAGGDHDRARRGYEDAVDCLVKSSAPYDAAVARLGLARALAALGRVEHAATEAAAARETFAALGAARDIERADAPLPGVAATDADPIGELSPRELEILRLIAQGLSDAEIAKQLTVSPHTVHRHVANVRTKLRLPSRSATVAYAARAGLL